MIASGRVIAIGLLPKEYTGGEQYVKGIVLERPDGTTLVVSYLTLDEIVALRQLFDPCLSA